MTSTARIPGVFSRLRLAALVLAVAAAAALTGCSQEGKTIQNALPVPGIAYDVTSYTTRNDTVRVDGAVVESLITKIVIMDVRVKVQTRYTNGCEARGGLELQQIGPLLLPISLIIPVARYTADEECNIGISGDTLQTLTLKNLTQPRRLIDGYPDSTVFARMQVDGSDGPPIEFEIRHDLATVGADSTLYDIKVEDATSGLPIDGALVSVQKSGTPNILGEGTTTGGGKFQFSVAYGILAGTAGDPYIVKVSYAGRITLFRAIEFPSLSRRREAIVVRV